MGVDAVREGLLKEEATHECRLGPRNFLGDLTGDMIDLDQTHANV